MACEIRVPRASSTMNDARVVSWLKRHGDFVKANEPVLALETDKATIDVESPVDGVLHTLIEEGQVREVGALIAYVLAPGESPPATATPEAPAPTGVEARPSPGVAAPTQTGGTTGELKATPSARRLARERGVDLALVRPTGPGGRIVEADVEAFVATVGPLPSREGRGEGIGTTPPLSGAEGEPLSRMRRAIGERMLESVRSKPHFSLEVEVDATGLASLRSRSAREGAQAPSYTALIVKACAQVLARHPAINASLIGDRVVRHRDVNVGVAIALPEGLLVPVVRSPDRKALAELDGEIRRLQEQAQQQRFSAAEVEGATFTVSNLGMLGIDSFVAIINPPESAILAVGRIAKRPVAVDDTVVVRPMSTLTLSIDHRVLDGAQASAFLMDLKETLENPEVLE